MSRSRFSPLALRALDAALRPLRTLHLKSTLLAGVDRDLPPDAAVLAVANHVSWWDGFLVLDVRNRLAPTRPIHTVMLERELARRPFLRWMGCLGIEPGSPGSVRRVLREVRRLRRRGPLFLSFFPQGVIRPAFTRPLEFRPGLEAFSRAVAPGILLPLALHLEGLNHPRPTAFVSVGPPRAFAEAMSREETESAVERELDALLAFLSQHGEDAPALWPSAGDPLPRP